MSSGRARADTRAYLVLLGFAGLWGAVSSGSPVYVRVLGGALGACCLVLLTVEFVRRRRNSRP